MKSLFPALVLAAATAVAAYRFRVRRRFEKLKVSGGKKALFLNLMDRNR